MVEALGCGGLALLAVFKTYEMYLAPGERGTIFVIAADRKQARTIMRYAHALLTGVPMLARMLEREAADAFDLNNHTMIEVATASFRSVRGYTLAAAICDELAFWRTEDSANRGRKGESGMKEFGAFELMVLKNR